ncbi:hypothetical protein HG536_0B02990 [Torulaspora globosa]|uniref:Major facilitator superfamily (MFS) profile domain-containing protein n=1 Tax=Torulaspora globosa TaxID=48254 RepID=A0A7G3ZD50_9SACH|nr:uncharacterized protein HG536_0B02990 [Torulaspora globosa]QLL31436.1 hypothetical protein HG536_0B02990 [Torulaspora globosa]
MSSQDIMSLRNSKENPPPEDEYKSDHHEYDRGRLSAVEAARSKGSEDAVPYSRFQRPEKFMLVVQCAFTGFFSTIAGAIYYPVLTVIEHKFNVSEEQVNITVVVYYIFQGLSPTLMGGFADHLGRRPIVNLSILLYCAACIGLACSNTYAQIVGLRCLQAAGISPVIAINSGIVGDVTTRKERGGYVGYISGFQVVGTAFGALIGAGLSSRWGWRSIFWFLAIGSGICLLFSLFLLPETKRTIAGNGSVTPKSPLNWSPVLRLPIVRRRLHLDDPDLDTVAPASKLNLLAPFSIIKIPEISLVLLVAGLQFSTWTTHQTALTTSLSKDYHLSVAKIGLCFLPSGICTLISIVSSGRYLNYNYRRKMIQHRAWVAQREQALLKEHEGDELLVKQIIESDYHYTFNIFRARMQPALFTVMLSSMGFISFGWCISVKAPLAAVLCTSGFASLFSNCILAMSVTLIVDLFPSRASTATGCLNLFRCALSAIFIACLTKMTQHMKSGGVFTFLGSITLLSTGFLVVVMAHGKKLSYRRRQQERKGQI